MYFPCQKYSQKFFLFQCIFYVKLMFIGYGQLQHLFTEVDMRRQKHEPRELSPYQKKLQDPRWQKMRLRILERDEWMCQKCYDSKNTLHVHHRYYMQGCDPWDYPPEALATLCARCHEEETAQRPLAEQHLLDVLRHIGLFYQDVYELADGFHHWKCPHLEEVTMCAITWMLKDEALMHQLIKQFFEHRARLRHNKGNGE